MTCFDTALNSYISVSYPYSLGHQLDRKQADKMTKMSEN